MNPEDHLVVRLLRFLNFGAAADRLVNSLLGGEEVILNPAIENAASSILKQIDAYKQLHTFHPSRDAQQAIFERVAKEQNLSQLVESEIVIAKPVAELS